MMKKLLLALLLLGMLGGAALLALWLGAGAPSDGIHIVINDHELNLAELHDAHRVAGGVGVLLAVCAAAVVVPLALLLGVLLPLLITLGALLLVAGLLLGAGALALSPLILPLALAWWLWRRSRRAPPAARPAAGTTIGA